MTATGKHIEWELDDPALAPNPEGPIHTVTVEGIAVDVTYEIDTDGWATMLAAHVQGVDISAWGEYLPLQERLDEARDLGML